MLLCCAVRSTFGFLFVIKSRHFLAILIFYLYFCTQMITKSAETLNLDVIHLWNDESLKMLYKNFYRALVVFSVQIVSELPVAEEIVQDVFVKIWQKQNTYKNVEVLKAYLYNAVRNESIDHVRHKNVEHGRVEVFERDFRLMQEDDEQAVEQHREELFRRLLLAIEALPPRMRQFFMLTIQGKTSEEIAEEMRVSSHAVKKLRQRGLERLRKELPPEALLLLLAYMDGSIL